MWEGMTLYCVHSCWLNPYCISLKTMTSQEHQKVRRNTIHWKNQIGAPHVQHYSSTINLAHCMWTAHVANRTRGRAPRSWTVVQATISFQLRLKLRGSQPCATNQLCSPCC